MDTLQTERAIFSVSDITRNIRFTLEEQFSGVWIEGEISGFKNHTSGHLYFSLKDEESQLQCVMFRRENLALSFRPDEGQKVLCYGRISVYPSRGQYQLYIERMEPKGIGALQLRFEQLKKKLLEEGLFDSARKRLIPFLPARVGVVTSIDGAALRDILHVLDRRFPDVHILIYPVPVQGSAAAPAIAAAIDDFNSWEAADVLIVGRGGGSLEDLWAFNEEIVARAIFRSGIPVISAVGHEVDFTIADFVADLRAATPSVAAEMVLPEQNEILLRLEELKARALSAILGNLKRRREELDALCKSRALRDPLSFFEIQCQKLDELTRSAHAGMRNFIRFKKEKILSLTGKLEALGPLSVLKRGFSVSLKLPEERVVVSAGMLKPGDRVRTKLSTGFFVSRVEKTG